MAKNKKVFFWDENTDKVQLSGYTHIRAYHGCRTSNVESYIKEGIHSFNRKQAYKMVRDTLLQCGIMENEIQKCFDRHWDEDIHHYNTIEQNRCAMACQSCGIAIFFFL